MGQSLQALNTERAKVWCQENELSEKTYYYWQHRIYQQLVSVMETAHFAEAPSEVKVTGTSAAFYLAGTK